MTRNAIPWCLPHTNTAPYQREYGIGLMKREFSERLSSMNNSSEQDYTTHLKEGVSTCTDGKTQDMARDKHEMHSVRPWYVTIKLSANFLANKVALSRADVRILFGWQKLQNLDRLSNLYLFALKRSAYWILWPLSNTPLEQNQLRNPDLEMHRNIVMILKTDS